MKRKGEKKRNTTKKPNRQMWNKKSSLLTKTLADRHSGAHSLPYKPKRRLRRCCSLLVPSRRNISHNSTSTWKTQMSLQKRASLKSRLYPLAIVVVVVVVQCNRHTHARANSTSSACVTYVNQDRDKTRRCLRLSHYRLRTRRRFDLIWYLTHNRGRNHRTDTTINLFEATTFF